MIVSCSSYFLEVYLEHVYAIIQLNVCTSIHSPKHVCQKNIPTVLLSAADKMRGLRPPYL